MNPVKIYQFTERDTLEIRSHTNPDPSIGKIVTLIQRAGSMNFQFDMTNAQARAMAAALIEHANALEA